MFKKFSRNSFTSVIADYQVESLDVSKIEHKVMYVLCCEDVQLLSRLKSVSSGSFRTSFDFCPSEESIFHVRELLRCAYSTSTEACVDPC